MQIIEENISQVRVLSLIGRIILDDGDLLLRCKISSLIEDEARLIVLNMEQVPYIDAAGLGELVRAHVLLLEVGGRLVLFNTRKRVADLLEITGLKVIFGVSSPRQDFFQK